MCRVRKSIKENVYEYCICFHVICLNVSYGHDGRLFKKARKALHYKDARMKNHTTTVANITFLNSSVSSLNKHTKKKTKANTVKLQNPNEAAAIVDHIKQSRLGKGAQGGSSSPIWPFKDLHPPSKQKDHPKQAVAQDK